MNNCAFDLGKRCHAMTEKKCDCCKFYKTKEQLKAGREKATERLMTLDRELLSHIKFKYHIGKGSFDDAGREES